jgi:hypothetical protein
MRRTRNKTVLAKGGQGLT